MEENNQKKSLFHFSTIAFILSVIFLLFGIMSYFLVFNRAEIKFKEVAPKLVFAKGQTVFVKTPFSKEFSSAKPNQILLAGTQVQTGDRSYAEIKIDNNIVRLDTNTHVNFLENNFNNKSHRLAFNFIKGAVWVNAFDPILIKASQAQARFDHTIGAYMYSEKSMNNIYSIVGNVDLDLFDKKSNLLSKVVIPLKNKVEFYDSQLVTDYKLLKYSKLKKELKMGQIVFRDVLDEKWVKRNTDTTITALKNNYISYYSSYFLKNSYYSLQNKLAFHSDKKRALNLKLAEIKLKYLLGGVSTANDIVQAKTILTEFDSIASVLQNDSSFISLIEKEFYNIRNIKTDTTAYLTKEKLREYLFKQNKNPIILRTYLADVNYLFSKKEIKQAEKISQDWLKQWSVTNQKKYNKEFDNQSHIYGSVILNNTDKITTTSLSLLDEVGDYRLKNNKEDKDVLFEIALDRLDVSKSLITAYRYSDARKYLTTSYERLGLSKGKISTATKDVFIKDAILIADRIAYAEKNLHGSAEPIDEAEFRKYLSTQEQEKSTIARFNSFLKQDSQKSVTKSNTIAPTVNDAYRKLTAENIVVSAKDIKVESDNLYSFMIQKATLVSSSKTGSTMSFSAKFDYITGALYEIILNEKSFKGNYSLKDFIKIAQTNQIKSPAINTSDLSGFLSLKDNTEAQLSRAVALDLAVPILIKNFGKYNILIYNNNQISPLDLKTLTAFKIQDALIKDSSGKYKIKVSFKYDSIAQVMSGITLKDKSSVSLPAKINVSYFAETVLKEWNK